jgi:hypothetical protein
VHGEAFVFRGGTERVDAAQYVRSRSASTR